MKVAIADLTAHSGKTTLALNLGAALAARGAKVALVDVDPEGPLDTLEGLSETGTVLDRRSLQMLRSTPVPGLDVITGLGRWLMQAATLPADLGMLPTVFAKFDWILFDTSAQHRRLVEHVLGWSDQVMMPLQMASTSFQHVPDMLRLMTTLRATHPGCKFAGLVRQDLCDTVADQDTYAAAQETLTVLRHEFPQVAFETQIPFDAALRTRDPGGAFPFAQSAPTRAAFTALADELLERLGHPVVTSSPEPELACIAQATPVVETRRRWWRRLFGRRA